jgi:LuxR family maltose regulon positive regulatory protein
MKQRQALAGLRSSEGRVVPAPLLETKLFVPKARRSVSRPRLNARLDRAAEARLSLVSAPAGFGKTTLLTDWLSHEPALRVRPRSIAWLSLDSADNDPTTFWTYLIAAVQTVAPSVGAQTLALLQTPQPPPIAAVLTTFLNDLGAVDTDIVLVLDDYHVIEAREVQEGMAFLLEHLPTQVHLVIAGRSDPAFPLARLRARGELVETRAADLRFTPDEAMSYLNDVMGLRLDWEDVAALEGRTEGWIAALQLAALSMQGRTDAGSFIAGFAGDDRYVVDYLVEEVLQRQSESVKAFLVQTSILGRMTAGLCDVVTGRDDGKAMLELLDQANLFVVPLDDRRQWYRYHHLFADVLQARLLDEHPDELRDLHRRASEWYEQHGEPQVAIEHALAAADFERAADLIDVAMPAMRRDRREGTLRGWLEALPDIVFRNRPLLSLNFVGALLSTNELGGVEPRLRDAERWLETATENPDVDARQVEPVASQPEYREVAAWVAVYRAGQAVATGDGPRAIPHAQRALKLLPADDLLGHGAASALIGLASWARGDLATAHRAYTDGVASLQKAGHIADVVGCAVTLADIRIIQGRLGAGLRTYETALQLAADQDGPPPRATADMYVGIGALLFERGDRESALQYLARSEELGDLNGFPQNPYRSRVTMARIRQAEGDLDAALDLLNAADRLYVGDFSPNVRPVPALRARLWVAQGRLPSAMDWAQENGLSAEDELTYVREFEHTTLARLLVADYEANQNQHSLDSAAGLLDRLLHAAEAGERWGAVIEILLLQARVGQARGDHLAALTPLTRALQLAEPEGYVQIFVDEGPAMAALLGMAAEQGIASRYVDRLLASFRGRSARPRVPQRLVDALSERELQVLRLLATDLSGPDIARELVVSLNTVRTHTKSIYAKLGVNGRRAAVNRAAELDLLSRRQRDA